MTGPDCPHCRIPTALVEDRPSEDTALYACDVCGELTIGDDWVWA